MKFFAVVLFSLFTLSQATAEQNITFKYKGKVVASYGLSELKKISEPKIVSVYEFLEKKNTKYEAFSFQQLLEKVYGSKWKKAEEVLFTCSDGYQPSVPSSKFIKHGSFLAFGKPYSDFQLVNKLQSNEKVKLGPFYLVWDNLNDKKVRAEGAIDIPYQVTTVDLVDFASRFPGMSPPKNRSAQVEKGFLAFRKNCVSCHSINGDGGVKSVELNFPVNVTEYMSENWITKVIRNPTSIRFNSKMPALKDTVGTGNEEQVAADIVAYLKAMKGEKRRPKQMLAE